MASASYVRLLLFPLLLGSYLLSPFRFQCYSISSTKVKAHVKPAKSPYCLILIVNVKANVGAGITS